MAANGRELAAVNEGRRRQVAPTNRLRGVSLVALVTALCFLQPLLTVSHAITCSCNMDNSAVTSCRWDDWTCTQRRYNPACFARRRVLDDGSIELDLGCVLVQLNPTFCNADRTTETYAVQCCQDGDLCNENMVPEFLSPAPNGTLLSPTPTIGSRSESPSLQTALPWSGGDGSGSGTAATYPVSTPTPDPPQDLLQCACSPCNRPRCVANYKCTKEVQYDPDTKQTQTNLGCLNSTAQVNLDALGVCNHNLDSENFKIRCCDDGDMCNEDIDVTLDPATSQPPTISSSTTEPPQNSSQQPTLGGDGKLKCECSRSLCDQQTWCFTNYKCFQDVKFESNFHHTRLGCIEAIREVNLDGIGVCNGALDTDNYKIQCCDSEDMCNRHLDVAPGKEDSRSPTDTGDPLPSPGASKGGKGEDDEQVYINLSIAVVAVTVFVTVVVMSTLVGVFCLRYQREKAKVTSVDQFRPSGLKQLSNSSITCTVIPSHETKVEHTVIHYV